MNPNIAKVIEVNNKKNIIIKGWATFISTKKFAVVIITHPIINDLVAAAPTNPRIISKLDRGAAKISNIVFFLYYLFLNQIFLNKMELHLLDQIIQF